MVGHRLRAGLGLAVAQLRYHRVRTVLSVLAIALAVLSTTVLAGVGTGVVETGTDRFQQSQQDLWVSGGPVRIAPGSVGGFENAILDAHRVAEAIGEREDVAAAAPIAYQTVYVGTDPSDLRTVVGVGVPNVGGSRVSLESGDGFSPRGDVHYANGTYTGPMTREVIVDRRTAEAFDLAPGDRLLVGGTLAGASDNEFTVVGVSPTFSEFLGTATVTLRLSELQTLAATAGADRAAVIAVRLEPGTDPESVEADLARAYPEYDVRTNREQFAALLRERAVVIASGVALAGLGVVTGIALTANAFALLVFQQRRALAALKAAGVSARTLAGVVAWQAVLTGLLGGVIGLALTPVLVRIANLFAARVIGFSGLAVFTDWILLLGLGVAIGIGLVSALVAGWRVVRIGPLEILRG